MIGAHGLTGPTPPSIHPSIVNPNRRSAPHLFLQLALLLLLAHSARGEWARGRRWARGGNLNFAAVLAGG